MHEQKEKGESNGMNINALGRVLRPSFVHFLFLTHDIVHVFCPCATATLTTCYARALHRRSVSTSSSSSSSSSDESSDEDDIPSPPPAGNDDMTFGNLFAQTTFEVTPC